MKTPRTIYQELKQHNRQQFWAISISFFILLIAIWIGITFQLVAIGDSNEEQQKLEHAQILNTLYPIKETFCNTEDSVFVEIIRIIGETNIDTVIDNSYNLLLNHFDKVYTWADTCLMLSEKAKYLLSKEDYLKISHNDFLVTIALPPMREIGDSLNSNNIDVYKWKYLLENSNHIKSLIEPEKNGINISFIDSFNLDLYNYYKTQVEFNETKIRYECKKTLSKITKSNNINSTNIDTLINNIKLDYQLKSSEIILKSLEESLKSKKCLINYKYIIKPLIDNYYIIQKNIKPLENTKVSYFASSSKNWNKIHIQIKKVNISSDFTLSIFSLIMFVVISLIIWYILLLFIIKKDEEKDKNSEGNIQYIEQLENDINQEKEYIKNSWKNNK